MHDRMCVLKGNHRTLPGKKGNILHDHLELAPFVACAATPEYSRHVAEAGRSSAYLTISSSTAQSVDFSLLALRVDAGAQPRAANR